MSLVLTKDTRLEEGLGWDSKQDETADASAEERIRLLPSLPSTQSQRQEQQVAEAVHALLLKSYDGQEPKTHPTLPPEKRGRRHRWRSVYDLNQFRHWWKTSRLLVRLAGAFVFIEDPVNWDLMGAFNVAKKKQSKKALKMMKKIGRGGPTRLFLQQVHPFTRTIRLVLAIARGLEARVDNRLVEVGFAEAFAFMGNRCFRYWARHLTDLTTKHVMFPLSATFLEDVFPGRARPFIILMGVIRAILPFASSFQGSRFGRQLTYATFRSANFRWRAIQSIDQFYEGTGVYQDTNPDADLLALVRKVAEAIGHGSDPSETRSRLASIGFRNVGSGNGGYAVYTLVNGRPVPSQLYMMHLTPYGPSILDEVTRFVFLERKTLSSGTAMLDPIAQAAIPIDANIQGYTYSGSFFKPQEWAALKIRFEREMHSYANACRIMGTFHLPTDQKPEVAKYSAPPEDLVSLKSFVRTGHDAHKQATENKRFAQINSTVHELSKLIERHQKQSTAPKQVILYFEGLDCAGKSSTGMLISHALEQCGYSVAVAQHNRPPTPEQAAKAWMDRGRFEHPEDLFAVGQVPEYTCAIWDRGPAGDFVYGNLYKLSTNEKIEKHREFMEYDKDCESQGILFLKLFFVADRDSIAATLGKRLAHKKIARDLKVWLDANSVPHYREGVSLIEDHVDPTDFIAFNKYEENLSRFTEFVRNTDTAENPWVVVNTSDRHSARKGVLKTFNKRLKRFSTRRKDRPWDALLQTRVTLLTERKDKGIPVWAILQALLLLCVAYGYVHQTWKIDIFEL